MTMINSEHHPGFLFLDLLGHIPLDKLKHIIMGTGWVRFSVALLSIGIFPLVNSHTDTVTPMNGVTVSEQELFSIWQLLFHPEQQGTFR